MHAQQLTDQQEAWGSGADDPVDTVEDRHRPFRAWALQQDLISLLGGGGEKRGAIDLGIERPVEADGTTVRGQAFLGRSLLPDMRLRLRTQTSIALWVAALLTDTVNQFGPTGLAMDSGDYLITAGSVLAAIFFTLLVYPRLDAKHFVWVEQTMLVFAYTLITFQCAVTGGAESPYLVWFIFTTFYAAYLLPTAQAVTNVAVATVAASSTLILDDWNVSDRGLLALATLLATSWLITWTLLRQRSRERDVERAVNFLALADPLTGVANLRAFEQFVGELMAEPDCRFALVMADMNGLKGANAVFGYDTGDDMLVRMARLMMSASNGDAQVARIGGDEFAVVLPGGDSDTARAWRARFEVMVDEHNARMRGRLPQISASVGSATYPDDAFTAADLLDQADRRMYEQKTPAVTPPYEIEGAAPEIGGLFRPARFADAPRKAVDRKDRIEHATVNWLIVGGLTLAALLIPSDSIHDTAAAITGAFGIAMAALCQLAKRTKLSLPILVAVDLSTIFYAIPSLLSTGGWQSPIQLAMILPVAFYAQYLRGRDAYWRIAVIMSGYAAAFWASGPVDSAGETLFVTVFTAQLLIAALLQTSARSVERSLALVRDSATHDPLTGARNLHAFRVDLGDAIRKAKAEPGIKRPALVIADINDFRKINTEAGHRGGDEILRAATQSLSRASAGEGRVYRVGSDEFAVLFEAERLLEAQAVAARYRAALEFRSVSTLASGFWISASVGFAIWHESLTSAQLVEAVESALAERKRERGPAIPSGTNVML